MKKLKQLGFTSLRGIILLSAILLSGCANMYVDNSTKEINSSEFKKPEPLLPVQTLFEFQSNGVMNAQATDFLKGQVIDQIESSGMFSKVSSEPVSGGGLLTITLNNVAVTDDAFRKGFTAGLTFGLVGSQVTDGYVCTARYMSDSTDKAIVKKARHAIYTTVGNSSIPSNATKAKNIEEAVTTMARQIVSNVLYDLSNDENF